MQKERTCNSAGWSYHVRPPRVSVGFFRGDKGGRIDMARRGRGEGTVYRRVDGRWEAALGVGGRRQRYVGQSQRDVRIKLVAARRALEQGIVVSGSSQRVEEYLTEWLQDSVRPSVR